MLHYLQNPSRLPRSSSSSSLFVFEASMKHRSTKEVPALRLMLEEKNPRHHLSSKHRFVNGQCQSSPAVLLSDWQMGVTVRQSVGQRRSLEPNSIYTPLLLYSDELRFQCFQACLTHRVQKETVQVEWNPSRSKVRVCVLVFISL